MHFPDIYFELWRPGAVVKTPVDKGTDINTGLSPNSYTFILNTTLSNITALVSLKLAVKSCERSLSLAS